MKKNRYDKIKEYNPLFLHLSKAYGDKQTERIKKEADAEYDRMAGILGDVVKAGFKVEWIRKDKEEVSFNMKACPYCEYLSKLGVPELTKTFCDSDEYAYCGLDNVDFIRTMTLGTGGDKCDFIYRRSDK